MLAKGMVLGTQFFELFEDNLYFDLASYANEQAMRIKQALTDNGYTFWAETSTNQLFPIISNDQISQLSQKFAFHHWKKIDEDHSAIRLITSWATTDEQVEHFIKALKKV